MTSFFQVYSTINQMAPQLYPFFMDAINSSVAPGTVTASSWWRSREENAQVRGDPHSQHLLGLALDVVRTGAEPVLVDEMIRKLRGLGLTVVDEGDHIHVQMFRAGIVGPLIEWLGLV